jgi:hypothetical protein
MAPKSLIHESELDMNRAAPREARVKQRPRAIAAALRTLAPRWLARRFALSTENPRRSLDRERQHFAEPWEENPRR